MKEKKKQYTLEYCLIAVALLGVTLFLSDCSASSRKKQEEPIGDITFPNHNNPSGDTLSSHFFNGNYQLTFDDLHELHTEEASQQGFTPMVTRKDTARMKGKIVYLKPAEYENFVVDSLPHSMPVMIPAVASLIDDIGRSFRDSLKQIGYPDCKMVVTSITRTDEDIKHLRRRNRNAIDDSAHRFGTTFDISWINFKIVDALATQTAYDRVLKRNLGNVLYQMQQQKRCYVKYETNQMCFHITIRKKG